MSDASSKTKTAPTKAPWNVSRAVIGATLAYLLAQTLAGILLLAYPDLAGWSTARTDDWLNNSIAAQFWYTVIAEAITLGVLWLFWQPYAVAVVRRALGLAKLPKWRDVGFAILGFATYLVVYAVILNIINTLVPVDVNQDQAVGFHNANGFGLVLAFISLVILPPIIEEITFRGFLYSGLRRNMGIVSATLITSVLFGLPHLLTGKEGILWVAMIDTFALSLILCFLREKTGSLYASILVHALKNTVAFGAIFVLHIS